jgi:hypothetical protein
MSLSLFRSISGPPHFMPGKVLEPAIGYGLGQEYVRMFDDRPIFEAQAVANQANGRSSYLNSEMSRDFVRQID